MLIRSRLAILHTISGRVYSVGGSFLYGSELEVPDPAPLKARASEGNKMGTDLA